MVECNDRSRPKKEGKDKKTFESVNVLYEGRWSLWIIP